MDEHAFLNAKDGDLYTILRLIPAIDESAAILTIDTDKLDKDIAAGTLKAKKGDREYVVEGSKEELDAYVRANLPTLFSTDMAGTIRLISGKKD